MTNLLNLSNGWLISHSDYITFVYKNTFHKPLSITQNICFCDDLFKINIPFKEHHNLETADKSMGLCTRPKKRRKTDLVKSQHEAGSTGTKLDEVHFVKTLYESHVKEAKEKGHFGDNMLSVDNSTNTEAREKSGTFYHESSKHAKLDFNGANNTETPVVCQFENELYIFPSNCKFFCCNISEVKNKMTNLEDYYDLILLDPPWWNKCIRRKKNKSVEATYKMMYNEDIAHIPIISLLAPGSLVAVWCTNSDSNLNALKNDIFPAWKVEYIGNWYWMKVTQSGQAICPFTTPPGKQPFERIVFGWRNVQGRTSPLPENGKMIISVPSAIHSHKPPISEVLSPYLPSQPKCLELFARYLLPGWTSVGNEVLKLQHLSLYKVTEESIEESSCQKCEVSCK